VAARRLPSLSLAEVEARWGRDRSWAIAARVAARQSTRIAEHYGHTVLGVSVASRRKGARQRKYRTQPVVRFAVSEKLSAAQLERLQRRPIPEVLVTRTRVRKRWYRVEVPTDVVVQGAVQLQQARDPIGTYVRVSLPFVPAERGAICCLVREVATDVLYMLSCGHVFALMRHSPDWQGFTLVQTDQVNPALDGVATVRELRDIARIVPFRSLAAVDRTRPSLDAAIALVDPAHEDDVSSSINGRRPRRVFRAISQLARDTPLRLVSPYESRAKNAEVEAVYTRHPLRIDDDWGSTWLVFPRLLEYEVKGVGTEAGDSGAAVLNLGGDLVGMHFAGLGQRGYAMLAADIFVDTTFDRTMRLEPNHN
jgi:hypothetical protein